MERNLIIVIRELSADQDENQLSGHLVTFNLNEVLQLGQLTGTNSILLVIDFSMWVLQVGQVPFADNNSSSKVED
jgi:hypothetical protein